MTLFDLTGKTALITGSSGGLGYAMAKGLAEAGARVIVHGRNTEKLEQARQALAEARHDVLVTSFDVTDEAAIERALADLDAQGIDIDILVNNAGIQLRKPLVETSHEEWQKVLDTNLSSTFLMGRHVARRMIARGQGGKVVNIGSLMSSVARPTVGAYTAAKGGVRLITQSMAAEWAEHGIQANAIGPGYMITEMTQPLVDKPEFNDWIINRTPARRWGTPDDLVGTVVYLAAPASNFVNGQIIYVDGGLLSVI
ncbi:glucose 1-dehydrogenase [Chromohalobacter israelensis]|uniref:Short-chain dehydrogenase/reductase SDR n=1 Tax=Chromohalobacter israelensis (strain ATCC BAA-138 / DSM 3043 / CIP 106854 / NCIMB 13768 / 1H11) TaxID=290398 RepID=Q1QYH3_CHRI1|nr:glucose 1-dehydrogenase [Chromohalobacter salexigens]ABE58485.1 short-chain dehydrogenase/reductase SDR [Chromohalobacter salexigens DSM 3043]MDO0944556.1 SDR family oxidoreductase [Chromohalobacter salexigens]